MRFQGRAWKLGHDVSSDELISARHVFEYDPRMLRRHLLAESRPEFTAQAAAGDLLVVGRRFAHGSQHSHPFLAMKEIGVGLIARTLARPPFRLAVYMGVPLLEIGAPAWDTIEDGDRLDVDFRAGTIDNLRSGDRHVAQPLPDFLLDIVAAGGGIPYLAPSPSAS